MTPGKVKKIRRGEAPGRKGLWRKVGEKPLDKRGFMENGQSEGDKGKKLPMAAVDSRRGGWKGRGGGWKGKAKKNQLEKKSPQGFKGSTSLEHEVR